MQSTPISGVRSLYISDKGIPKQIFEELPSEASNINDGTNIEAAFYSTKAPNKKGYSFLGYWNSASSQVLVYFKAPE
jgi:hypothetical protein